MAGEHFGEEASEKDEDPGSDEYPYVAENCVGPVIVQDVGFSSLLLREVCLRRCNCRMLCCRERSFVHATWTGVRCCIYTMFLSTGVKVPSGLDRLKVHKCEDLKHPPGGLRYRMDLWKFLGQGLISLLMQRFIIADGSTRRSWCLWTEALMAIWLVFDEVARNPGFSR